MPNMELNDLIKEFEAAKKKVEPIARERRLVLPIFRVKREWGGHFVGDGFFYSSQDKISWKYLDSGHDTDATPEKLLEAYRFYIGNDITMEEALADATKRLNNFYEDIKKERYSTLLSLAH